jgi:hypothetical protein
MTPGKLGGYRLERGGLPEMVDPPGLEVLLLAPLPVRPRGSIPQRLDALGVPGFPRALLDKAV